MRLGELLEEKLGRLKQRFEFIGDVRGLGLYQMLDIVEDRQSKKADFNMAERIRFNAVGEGLILLTTRNNIRLSPPLTITEDELDDAIGRLEQAMVKAERGEPADLDLMAGYDTSSSLAHRAESRGAR